MVAHIIDEAHVRKVVLFLTVTPIILQAPKRQVSCYVSTRVTRAINPIQNMYKFPLKYTTHYLVTRE